MDAKALKAFSQSGKWKSNTGTSKYAPINKVVIIDGDNEPDDHSLDLFSFHCGGISSKGNTVKMVLTFSPQIAFLGRALESNVGMLEKEHKEKVHKKLQTKFAALKKAKEEVDTANDQQAKSLKLAKEAFAEEKIGREADVNNLKTEIAFQYEHGFYKAIEQLKFQFPNLDLGEVGAFKQIQDGKLVDLPNDDE
ncbi:hypothetical protein SESBI_21868 [Sesbania bispinosa]|nr:hypothetical protein SESBI_21868 [Sesbania bispinosa]